MRDEGNRLEFRIAHGFFTGINVHVFYCGSKLPGPYWLNCEFFHFPPCSPFLRGDL
jgi:hypothetical protein